MSKIILFLFTIFGGICLNAQDLETISISEEACDCAKNIVLKSEKEEKYDAIKSCISSSIFSYQLKDGLKNIPKAIKDTTNNIPELLNTSTIDSSKKINIEITTDKNFKKIEAYLLSNCEYVKRLMQIEETLGENSMSDIKEAIDYYNNGQVFYTNKEYKKAIKEYEKAVKVDKNFAFAWDKLGYSNRQLGEYEKAIKYYNKSLKLNPIGKMPLMNKPISYQLMGELDKAIKSYEDFIAVYPNDPEGFYGIGRIYFDKGKYEYALDNMMKSYILYKKQNSPYINDAETNLKIFYSKLKELNKLDLFEKMADKYKITY